MRFLINLKLFCLSSPGRSHRPCHALAIQAGWLAWCVCCALLNLEMKCSFCCSSNLHKSTAISHIRNEKCISRGSIDSTRLHRFMDEQGREEGEGRGGGVVTLLHTLSMLTRQCLKYQLVSALNYIYYVPFFLFLISIL